jgi:hypothetical protein
MRSSSYFVTVRSIVKVSSSECTAENEVGDQPCGHRVKRDSIAAIAERSINILMARESGRYNERPSVEGPIKPAPNGSDPER